MDFTRAHAAAILAFSLWGILPLFWKIFSDVSAWDLFGHRLIWSFVTVTGILIYKKQAKAFKDIWSNKKTRYLLMLSALLISSNWLLYIYAVQIGKVLEASMGYFLNPIINIAVGWLILNEKIRPTQWPAIILVVISMIFIALKTDLSHFPWIAITLSLTFAFYGLLRKVTHVGALEGLAFETAFMVGPVLIYWYFQSTTPGTAWNTLPGWQFFVLTLSGIVTSIPLILFAYSTKQLKLQTIGFIQYLSPSFKFICGLFILHEPLSTDRLYGFIMIWIALAWYSGESVLMIRKNQKKLTTLSE